MCCCGKPTINGEAGYSWNGKSFGKHPVHAPFVEEGESLLFDEPGRCGGVDSHSYHFRITMQSLRRYFLLVRHGGGEERIELSGQFPIDLMKGMDSNQRYWLMQSFYHAVSQSVHKARREESADWELAAIEKRIKVRRRRGTVRVERIKRVVELV